jgi:predicted amidophosphoribosyltransferase
MSLEACPTCGYALSTTTAHCRHCTGELKERSPVKKINAMKLVQALAPLAAIGCLIYYWCFR